MPTDCNILFHGRRRAASSTCLWLWDNHFGTLADPRNGVRQAGEELSVDGVVVCQLPATRLETVALMTAAHAVFYTKFTGTCRALFEILYRSVGFDVNLSGLSQKVWEVTQVV